MAIGEKADKIDKLPKAVDRRIGFHRHHAGGPSRWSSRERKPIPLEPKLVAEVSADHIENGRFRHGSRLVRGATIRSLGRARWIS